MLGDSTPSGRRSDFHTGEFVQLMGRIRRGEARDKDYDRLNKVGAKKHADDADVALSRVTGANALALARPVRGVDIKTPKMATAFYELLDSLEAQTKILGAPLDLGPLALRERFGGTEHDPLGTARGVGPGPQLTALEAIERLDPSLDIEEEQPHVLHWQTKKPSVAREEFGGHGVGSTTKGAPRGPTDVVFDSNASMASRRSRRHAIDATRSRRRQGRQVLQVPAGRSLGRGMPELGPSPSRV